MSVAPDRPARRAYLGLAAYRMATRAVGPVVPYLLSQRLKRGKEDAGRIDERRGIAALDRPQGTLAWLHAASVGESLSILPLITQMRTSHPHLNILVTTGTVTSAKLMAERLPIGAIHQYVPLDHPDYCARFLDHWRPDLGIWVESEFWPNLIVASTERHIPLALVNARITAKSFEGWQRFPKTIGDLVSRFSVVLAQDQASATRLRALGVRSVGTPGNLKHDAMPLTADAVEVEHLRRAIVSRPLWLATNTHEGEDLIAAEVHRTLIAQHKNLITFIVPRHPARGETIASALRADGLNVCQRSQGETITSATDIYLADTLGELGIFYRLAEIVFIGGTMNDLGGHNPFEPARLTSALIAGPSDFNFTEAFDEFADADALIRVEDTAGLASAVGTLLDDPQMRMRRANAAERVVSRSGQATEITSTTLLALLATAPQKNDAAHA